MQSSTTLLQEAKLLGVSGKHREAIQSLDLIVQKAATSGREPILAEALNARGIARRMLGEYDGALEDYQSALAATTDCGERAAANINIADIHRVARSDYVAAHASLDEALTFCDNGSLSHAKAVDQRGLVFFAQKDYNSAITSYNRARTITEKLLESKPEDKDAQNRYAQIIQHLGGAFLYMNDPARIEDAYGTQTDALKIFKKLGDNVGIFNSVSVLGKIAVASGDFKRAVEQYTTAYEILEGASYERGIGGLHLDMCEAQLNLKDTKTAGIYLRRFADSVQKGHLTEYDLTVMNEQIERVNQLCNESPQLTTMIGHVIAKICKTKN